MSELKVYKKPQDKNSPKVKKLFIAGVGAVGNTLLKQVSRYGTEKSLRVLGVCNSHHLMWYDRVQSSYSLRDLLRAPDLDWERVFQKLTSYEKGSVVFVDTTGSLEIAELYPRLLENHIHVVTPSKLANTQKQDRFDLLHRLAAENGVDFLYETNVGAGLPIISSIKDLILTGDEILEISGVLSGTMTYLFSELDKGGTFSETVLKARRLGYAEPDPRDDLSGEDVARKFMILARICAHQIERDQLEVESLIPKNLQDVDSSTFLERLHEYDEEWKRKCEEAAIKNETLRYVGRYYKGNVEIGIQSVPISSALGQLKGTTNQVSIRSRRYNDQPMVIQGPGAGKEVTAAGVLADLLSIR